MDSVVVVKSDDGVGTGFAVGRRGYILTCAHVLAADGTATVLYKLTINGETKTFDTQAEPIRIDEARDVALLKAGLVRSLKPLILSDRETFETGEKVTVIGNPGVGSKVLSHTMTTGIVSNAQREIGRESYLQTSAAVNPGNSGGPVFDGRGRVIGMVARKADIEATGFAIPASELRQFLLSATEDAE